MRRARVGSPPLVQGASGELNMDTAASFFLGFSPQCGDRKARARALSRTHGTASVREQLSGQRTDRQTVLELQCVFFSPPRPLT